MEKVLIIDDDRFTQNILQKNLFKVYEVRTADDGAAGLNLANRWHPDVILLDVEMPGQNGYEVCDILKRDASTQEIPVIFLSSHSSTRERMLGFEVGGDDFLVKPCSAELLQKKIDKIAELYNHKRKLKQSVSNAEKTALEAMSTSFELGKAVRYVERTYTLSTVEKLGAALMEFLTDLELSACAMLCSREQSHFFSTGGGMVAPLEIEVLQALHGAKRFTDFGCRTQINYPQVALLVKNMPLEDRARYGRLKDTLPFVLGATDAKVRVLDAEKSLLNQNQKLVGLIGNLQSLLESTGLKFNADRDKISDVMTNLTTTLGVELYKMGLESDQEEYVVRKVEDASNLIYERIDGGKAIEKAMQAMVKTLQTMADDQEKIIAESLSSDDGSEAEDITNDIELF